MKPLLRSFSTSQIVRKLTTRILIIEAASFLIIFLLSLVFLWPLLNRQAIDEAGDICAQMKNTIESSMAALQSSSQYISSSRELKSALDEYYMSPTVENFELVRLVANELSASHNKIRSLVLEGPDHTLFDSITNLTETDFSILRQDWNQLVRTNEYGSGYSRLFEPYEDGKHSLAYSKSFLIDTDKYVLTLFYDAGDMLHDLEALAGSVFSAFSLIDHGGDVFYSAGSLTIPEERWQAALAGHSGVSVSRYGGFYIASVPASLWNLAAYADVWSINQAFIGYFVATIILFAALGILTFVLIIPLIHSTISPLGELATTMSHIKDGNLDVAVSEIRTGDEIEVLSDAYNEMMSRLHEQVEKRFEHEKREQKMKYGMLASQIDPHFICNTITTINFLARDNRTDDIIRINSALISLLRDRLRVESIRVFDSVTQEVEAVESYLIIQGYRYRNNARLVWNIDEDVLTMPIPKNIIQPLVENALFHGLMDDESGEINGNIAIDIRRKDDGMEIVVQDDGKGIDEEQLRRLNAGEMYAEEERGRHIGIKNIRERLYYLYQSEGCMSIESNEGTRVSVLLSARRAEGGDA